MATSYTHSIPTPPFSPQNYRMPDEQSENQLKSTINLLDSLVAFYQHERMWVYRTRAALENAFPAPPITNNGDVINNATYPDCHTSATTTLPSDDEYYESAGNAQKARASRWMRRKKGFKMRIDGIRAKRVINTQPLDQTQDSDLLPPREQILDMFDKMMEARLESCQRIDKLVREANRSSLHNH